MTSASFDQTFTAELLAALPAVRAFCRKLTRNATTADDLVQEAVCRAWEHRNNYVIGSRMPAWLYVIARNAHYTANRRAKFTVEDPDGIIAKNQAFQPTQERTVEARERFRLVQGARLPHDAWPAILALAGGESYEEIAARTGVAVGTVKSRISRGRAMLAEAVAE